MKSFLKSIFFISLATLLILTCSPQEEAPSETPPSSSSSAGNETDGDKADDKDWVLNCVLPACEGESCCHQDDDQCDDWCTGTGTDDDSNDFFGLGGDLATKCLALSKDTVEHLIRVFKVLKTPTTDTLENLDEEDIGLICGTVKEWQTDLLKTRVNKYSTEQAKQVLTWMVNNPATIEIFENAKNADGFMMIKTLFQKATQTEGDPGVLKGLEMEPKDSPNNILLTINEYKNKSFIQYIHQEIIAGDEGICSGNNYPVPADPHPDKNKADDFNKQACVLAVYCKVAPPEDTKNSDFRKDIARMANDNNMINFIKISVNDGGLNGDGQYAIPANDEHRWSDKVCTNLKHYWNNGPLPLDL